jgi:putative chitinase
LGRADASRLRPLGNRYLPRGRQLPRQYRGREPGRLGRKPGEGPLSLDRQAEIANILYGGEFGRKQLGNTEPGDGWAMRGYGPKQLTGRDNQTRFAEAMGISVDEVPALIRTREGGMMSAGWFWKSHNLDAKAATPGVEDDRRAINGGLLGVAEVDATFDKLIAEMLRRERAAA